MKSVHKSIQGISSSRLLKLLDRNFLEGIFHYANKEITYANQTFISLFGFSSFEELQKTETNTLFVDAHAPARILSKTEKEGAARNELLQLIRKDTTTFWGSFTIEKLFDENGEYYIGTLNDVTERLHSDKILKEKNADLKKVNEQMDRFLYSASHDFRQPLTSIMGLIRLMRMESSKEDSALYLDKLGESVNKLDQFLRQIMQFSRNSHERIVSEQIDLKNLVEAIFNKYSFHRHSEAISFSVELTKPMVFYSDITRIESILEHVIKNSVEYIDLSKPQPFIKVVITFQINQIVIEVIDNGTGIPQTHLPKVCEMFYRATDRSKGSGLGLYIVKEALLKLGGSISIDSEINLGTIVQIQVPNGQKGRLINKKVRLLNDLYE